MTCTLSLFLILTVKQGKVEKKSYSKSNVEVVARDTQNDIPVLKLTMSPAFQKQRN